MSAIIYNNQSNHASPKSTFLSQQCLRCEARAPIHTSPPYSPTKPYSSSSPCLPALCSTYSPSVRPSLANISLLRRSCGEVSWGAPALMDTYLNLYTGLKVLCGHTVWLRGALPIVKDGNGQQGASVGRYIRIDILLDIKSVFRQYRH